MMTEWSTLTGVSRRLGGPKTRCVSYMALSMAVNYFGYEFIRSSVFGLFTSESTGFKDSSSVTSAMACSGPCSLLLLVYAYGRQLEIRGPRSTLRNNTLLCASVFLASSTWLGATTSENDDDVSAASLRRWCVFALFVFQNSYVHLLSTQHWAFLSSLLTSEEGSLYFAPIAGLASVTATASAATVSRVRDVSAAGLLSVGGASLLLSASLSDRAYAWSELHGLLRDAPSSTAPKQKDTGGLLALCRRARLLFARVPILRALLAEVVACGLLVSTLNFFFVLRLRETTPDDALRTAYSGRFHALVNASSSVLQFGPLSLLLSTVEASRVFALMPSMMLALALSQRWGTELDDNADPLAPVAASYFLVKTIEYSVHGVACEMVYVTLDYESRFIGKEIIGVVGNKIGRSGISLVLSFATNLYGDDNLDQRLLLNATVVLSVVWLLCGLRLSRLVASRKRDENEKETTTNATSHHKTTNAKKTT